jgi:Putative zinc-finger
MNSKRECQVEQIAAYLDGELDDQGRRLFESHLSDCALCGAELADQRRLLCALDSVLSRNSDLPLPLDFARIVAAHAESDMSGVRERSENGRAVRLCLLLAAAAVALLGVATRGVVLSFGRSIWRSVSAIGDLVWTTVYDAGTSLTIVSRVLSQGLVPNRALAGPLGVVLLALAVLLLSRLITNYHRADLIE